jgi:hypothetical protein
LAIPVGSGPKQLSAPLLSGRRRRQVERGRALLLIVRSGHVVTADDG